MTHLDEQALAAKAWADLEMAASATGALEVANVTLPIEKVRALVAERVSALPSSPVSEWTAHLERVASSLEKNGFSLEAEDCQALSSTLTSLSTRNAELERGIDRLAAYIMENVPGEPSENQGAVDTAIRLLGKNAELEREVKRLREAQQWRPIETAPKDGTEIIARDCATGTSHVTFWNGGWHDPDSHYYSEAPDFVPSVWFPLPETSALSTTPQGGEHE